MLSKEERTVNKSQMRLQTNRDPLDSIHITYPSEGFIPCEHAPTEEYSDRAGVAYFSTNIKRNGQ